MLKIGVFIDSVNINKSELEYIKNQLSEHGKVIFINQYSEELSNYNLPDINYHYTDDSYEHIIIDSLQKKYTLEIDSIAIVSNNNNYELLIHKLGNIKSFFFSHSILLLEKTNSINYNLLNHNDLESIVVISKEEIISNTINNLKHFIRKINPSNNLISINQIKKENQFDNIDITEIVLTSSDFIVIKDKNDYFVKLQNFNEFITIENDDFRLMILDSFYSIQKVQEEVFLNTYYNHLATNFNFNYKNYGFNSFIDFLVSLKLFNIINKKSTTVIELI